MTDPTVRDHTFEIWLPGPKKSTNHHVLPCHLGAHARSTRCMHEDPKTGARAFSGYRQTVDARGCVVGDT